MVLFFLVFLYTSPSGLVFYWIATPTGRAIFDKLVWILCGVMLVNYMFFGTDLGIISAKLQYENGLDFGKIEQLLNVFIILLVAAVLYYVCSKWSKAVKGVLLTATIAVVAMSGLNISTIHALVSEVEGRLETDQDAVPHFNLSKNGQNVVVIMLDRAMGPYIPYIMNERPELQEQFAGFTYYSNTISFGPLTNFGTPALFGGYEYTPVKINKREDESLVSKQNEALKVMPVLFSENGYDVTVMAPPYANYQWIPDLSIYDEYPEIDAYITNGMYGGAVDKEVVVQNTLRNFFCFSVMKTMPLVLQETIYEHGGYNVLRNMNKLTTIMDEDVNTFMMFSNNATHEPTLLQLPDYEPDEHVDNTSYQMDLVSKYTLNATTMKMEEESQITHYHVNMAAMIQLGKWFDYLRENDVYDNTRIIITSDHGRSLQQFDELVLDPNGGQIMDAELFYPLLMVKDFGAKEFTVSDEFMTNADIPTLAVDNLITNAVNPFTGKVINNYEKTAHKQFIIASYDWDVNENNGNVFLPSYWWSVEDDIWDKDNWDFIGDFVTRPDELEE